MARISIGLGAGGVLLADQLSAFLVDVVCTARQGLAQLLTRMSSSRFSHCNRQLVFDQDVDRLCDGWDGSATCVSVGSLAAWSGSRKTVISEPAGISQRTAPSMPWSGRSCGFPLSLRRRPTTWRISSAAIIGSSCAQKRSTTHPESLNSSVVSRSRARLVATLRRQKSTFDAGSR